MESKEDLLIPIFIKPNKIETNQSLLFHPFEYDYLSDLIDNNNFQLEIINGLQINQLTNPIYKFVNEEAIFTAIAANLSQEVIITFKLVVFLFYFKIQILF
jgi:hypothetical protein